MTKTAMLVALLSGALSAQSSIIETAQQDGRFKTLVAALGKSTAIKTLSGKGPFTVFAPTDQAFAKIDSAVIKGLLKRENRDTLDAILTYHVVPGALRASDVVKRSGLQTANGQRVDVSVHGKDVRIDASKVLITDIECSNGIIHVIDTVLMPESRSLPEIANRRVFGTLIAAVEAAGLLDALSGKGPFTILAPTDQAFAKLPKGTVASLLKPENRSKLQNILKYHVIPGRVPAAAAVAAGSAATLQGQSVGFEIANGRLRVQGANVTKTDVDAVNGVVHVIDSVLLPPAPPKPKGRLVIGFTSEQPSPALAAQLHIDRKASLIIESVTKGSCAEAAGLQRYDVLTSVNGKKVSSKSLARAKEDVGYGGTVELDVIRKGKKMRVSVEVGVAAE
ncbi:MAG: fasciclin domain-containing protein [Planctomycetota bacterium]